VTTSTGSETSQTPLQAVLDTLLSRDDVPAEALHGRVDAEAAWSRWQAHQPARSEAERWWYGQFAAAGRPAPGRQDLEREAG
jgi:hypothetical protein